MAAVRIFTFQLVQQGFTQHSISLAVNKDDALFAPFFVLFHHFTKLIQLVIQYFAVAHTAGVIQQLADMQVNLDNPILAATLDDRLRFERSICRFFLYQSLLQFLCRNIHLLDRLTEQPEHIAQPAKQSAPIHSTTQAELDEVLNTQPLDEDAARSLICKLAQEQYDAIGSEEYETERLRRLFTAFECTAELNAELLQSAVSAVLVTRQAVRLQLKNGQIIGKDDLV